MGCARTPPRNQLTTGVKRMALEMRTECERCGIELIPEGVAFICSYECTWCAGCAELMNHICFNCRGNLVLRPTRL